MIHMPSTTQYRTPIERALPLPTALPRLPDRVRRNPWSLFGSHPVLTSRATRTVLVVEDDPEQQELMSDHFTRMDIHVLVASHYAAAVVHLASRTLDLACVDIGLPTQSGFELCEYIRGPLGLKLLPIMVMSEGDWPADRAYAEEAGANAFLTKPFSLPELGANVAALLDGARPRTPHMFRTGA
jgi:DNA-binding response OmpR family regulator